MKNRTLAIVVNPCGGKRKGLRVLDRVKQTFADAGIDLDIHITQRSNHASEIARTLDLGRIDGICAVGGDGTVHEVVDGLMQRGAPISIPLGVIPAGTGNAFAQHLDCCNPIQAAQRIVAGRTQPMDVVEVTLDNAKVHCINIVGWGAVSDINGTAEKLRFLGTIRYTLAALWHIAAPTVRKATIILDGKSMEDDYLFVMACNTKFTGAGMKLAPQAEMGDGMIDVAIIRQTSRWQMLNLFRRVFDGSHVALPCIEFHQVRSFEIHSASTDKMNLDGEMKGYSPMSAKVLPSTLSVFV